MPIAPQHPCGQPGCYVLVDPGKARCPQHARPAWHGAGRPMARGWDTLRAQVLCEEPICRLCPAPSTTVDHITPRYQGGNDDRSNLRGLCAACHTRITQQQSHEARARHSPSEVN